MRSKLKLALEDVNVVSFDTSAAAGSAGTVVGAQDPYPETFPRYTCYHSCDWWCATDGPTCDADGIGTCGMRQC